MRKCVADRERSAGVSIFVIGDGDEGVVALRAALVHKKVIVAAAALLAGIFSTWRRARVIDRAAPLFGVEELTDAAEVFVAFSAHQIFMAMAFARVAPFGGRKTDFEVFREPFDVPLGERDHGIRAAISWAVETIVVRHRRRWPPDMLEGCTKSYYRTARCRRECLRACHDTVKRRFGIVNAQFLGVRGLLATASLSVSCLVMPGD